MFRNKLTCPNCHERIDALSIDCPYCHTHNFEYDKLKLSENAFNVSIVWQIVFFIVGWIGIQVIGAIIQFIFLANAPSGSISANDPTLIGPIEFITYFLEAILMVVLVFVSKSKRQFIKPFTSFKSYVFGAVAFLVIYAASKGYGEFIVPSNIETSGNQQLVISITTQYPLLSLIVLGILGPLCEELTYRVGLFGLLRRWNRLGAYIISVFVFAFVHFDANAIIDIFSANDYSTLIRELWNFPAYLIGGIGLVTTYDLFGFGASSIAHMLNNIIGIIDILLIHYASK